MKPARSAIGRDERLELFGAHGLVTIPSCCSRCCTSGLFIARATSRLTFCVDMHTHFLGDHTRIRTFVNMRNAVGKAGRNKALAEREQTIEDLKFDNSPNVAATLVLPQRRPPGDAKALHRFTPT
jgi:hypothetical protein